VYSVFQARKRPEKQTQNIKTRRSLSKSYVSALWLLGKETEDLVKNKRYSREGESAWQMLGGLLARMKPLQSQSDGIKKRGLVVIATTRRVI
jgi:hypothetical protein